MYSSYALLSLSSVSFSLSVSLSFYLFLSTFAFIYSYIVILVSFCITFLASWWPSNDSILSVVFFLYSFYMIIDERFLFLRFAGRTSTAESARNPSWSISMTFWVWTSTEWLTQRMRDFQSSRQQTAETSPSSNIWALTRHRSRDISSTNHVTLIRQQIT